MKKTTSMIIIGALAVCAFPSVQVSQERKPCATRTDIILSSNNPTVYITYEGATNRAQTSARLADSGDAEKEPSRPGTGTAKQRQRAISLRIHNNTSWAIGLPTESLYVGPAVGPWRLCDGSSVLGLREGIEISARYEVEPVGQEKEGRRVPRISGRIDVYSTSWLPPGQSVIFTAPREHITEQLALYIPFNYEWEMERGHVRGGEPEHRVYFYSWNLPEKLR